MNREMILYERAVVEKGCKCSNRNWTSPEYLPSVMEHALQRDCYLGFNSVSQQVGVKMAKSNGLQIEFPELYSFFSGFVKGTTQLQPREGSLDACCAHGEVLP